MSLRRCSSTIAWSASAAALTLALLIRTAFVTRCSCAVPPPEERRRRSFSTERHDHLRRLRRMALRIETYLGRVPLAWAARILSCVCRHANLRICAKTSRPQRFVVGHFRARVAHLTTFQDDPHIRWPCRQVGRCQCVWRFRHGGVLRSTAWRLDDVSNARPGDSSALASWASSLRLRSRQWLLEEDAVVLVHRTWGSAPPPRSDVGLRPTRIA